MQSTTKEHQMNKAKIIELFLDGAYYVVTEQRLYHSSFRKGYRSITSGNISLVAAKRALGDQFKFVDGVFKI
jgi:hypothetical protein